ncbi:TIGR04282 family arsenosugar biosynthesis glycosyltransferase [Tepidicaulis sp.]|uniref:TIGR04282 family arsenosugar biosynthesis glycosyltransferase n=1 Tax=Tepidicaulis sp. TaxID=1920809 RepID=UPI003B5BAAA6
MTPQLVIMSKLPRLGQVKTRLARDIGAVEALRFYKTASAALMRKLGQDPRWQTLLAVAPDSAVDEPGFFPPHLPLVAQGGGDLGARMGHLMRSLAPGPIVMIGGDIPDIESRHIAAAFKALGSHDAVFGPAEDGGYWLVGLKRFPRVPEIFGQVRWSSETTLDDTLANLKGARVALLEALPDIDTGADFHAWRKKAKR